VNYSLHDTLVLEAPSRAAQAAKLLRVLEHFSASAGPSLARSSCLDVGCSSGIITHALAPHFRRMVGVDVDAHALSLARPGNVDAPALSLASTAPASFATASGLALPFAEGTFDLALCNQVYQYVPDVPHLLAEIHRVLRPGGACYFSARNLWGIAAPENRLPFLASLSPRAAAFVSRGSTAWQHRAGTLWPYRRLRALAARFFAVFDYTTRVLSDPSLAELFVPARYHGVLSRAPSRLLALAIPVLPTHIWVLQKRA
jgi:SAM-dependent methyltransferase